MATRLKAPEGCGNSATFAGVDVTLDQDCCIELDSPEAISAALSHGFTPAADAPKAQPKATTTRK